MFFDAILMRDTWHQHQRTVTDGSSPILREGIQYDHRGTIVESGTLVYYPSRHAGKNRLREKSDDEPREEHDH